MTVELHDPIRLVVHRDEQTSIRLLVLEQELNPLPHDIGIAIIQVVIAGTLEGEQSEPGGGRVAGQLREPVLLGKPIERPTSIGQLCLAQKHQSQLDGFFGLRSGTF